MNLTQIHEKLLKLQKLPFKTSCQKVAEQLVETPRVRVGEGGGVRCTDLIVDWI